jgi:hypothetical protein
MYKLKLLKGSETMEGSPRSPICDFKPQYENINQYAGAFNGLLSIIVDTDGLS